MGKAKCKYWQIRRLVTLVDMVFGITLMAFLLCVLSYAACGCGKRSGLFTR